jgi:hypothetical protein
MPKAVSLLQSVQRLYISDNEAEVKARDAIRVVASLNGRQRDSAASQL